MGLAPGCAWQLREFYPICKNDEQSSAAKPLFGAKLDIASDFPAD
jgi:hypothetical protein